jgi:hypothetical protein
VWRGRQGAIARNPDFVVLLEFNAPRLAQPALLLADIERAGFPLRVVEGDASLRSVSVAELCARPDDATLFLARAV